MKKFLIINTNNEIIGSYEAEEKDETSNNRSYLTCPPHATHYEMPEGLELPFVELQEVEIQAEQNILVRAAQDAQAEVLAQDAIFDEDGVEVAPAIEHQDAVKATKAVYSIVPAVRGLGVVESLDKARVAKLASIRAERDARMADNDKAFIIAFKKDEDLANIKASAQILRDFPEVAEAALSVMSSLVDINSYNPFGE